MNSIISRDDAQASCRPDQLDLSIDETAFSARPASIAASGFGEIAPALHRAGLNVVPVDHRKVPRVTWKRWQENRQTLRDLDCLRQKFGDYGTTIILGGPGLRLVDVEAEILDGEVELDATGLPLPKTACFKSNRRMSLHRFYHCEAQDLRSNSKAIPGVDFLAGPHLVTVPTSYGRAWINTLDDLADLPAEWETFWRRASAPTPPKPPTPTPHDIGTYVWSKRLEEFYRGAGVVRELAEALGVKVGLEKSFRCVLPGHEERRASASFKVGTDGVLKYIDWHRRDGPGAFVLPEVFAAQVSGAVRTIRGTELALWGWRLAAAAGLVRLPEVVLPVVRGSLAVQRVREGFMELLAVRWLRYPGESTMFTRSFAARWCGVSEDTVVRAMLAMRQAGVIVKAGMATCPSGRRAALWLPRGQGH